MKKNILQRKEQTQYDLDGSYANLSTCTHPNDTTLVNTIAELDEEHVKCRGEQDKGWVGECDKISVGRFQSRQRVVGVDVWCDLCQHFESFLKSRCIFQDVMWSDYDSTCIVARTCLRKDAKPSR